MQTHFNHNNLEAPLIGCNSYSTANSEFFRDVGLGALIRNFKASRLNKDILENCCISLFANRISLLPGTSKSNRESFENEMDILAIKLLREIEEYYDYVFLDVCSGKHPLSLKLIEESDLTIINLSQNMEIVSSFFTTYQS